MIIFLFMSFFTGVESLYFSDLFSWCQDTSLGCKYHDESVDVLLSSKGGQNHFVQSTRHIKLPQSWCLLRRSISTTTQKHFEMWGKDDMLVFTSKVFLAFEKAKKVFRMFTFVSFLINIWLLAESQSRLLHSWWMCWCFCSYQHNSRENVDLQLAEICWRLVASCKINYQQDVKRRLHSTLIFCQKETAF